MLFSEAGTAAFVQSWRKGEDTEGLEQRCDWTVDGWSGTGRSCMQRGAGIALRAHVTKKSAADPHRTHGAGRPGQEDGEWGHRNNPDQAMLYYYNLRCKCDRAGRRSLSTLRVSDQALQSE